MRLTIRGFSEGLVDEDVITRMGLANLQLDKEEDGTIKEAVFNNCPATDIESMDFYTKHTLSKMRGRESLHISPWKNSAIIRMYQWQATNGIEYALTFSCASGA